MILVSDCMVFIIFFSFSPWVKVKEAREGILIQWFFFSSFFALVRRQQKRETEKITDEKQNVCVGLCGRPPSSESSENAKKKMTW